MFALLLVDGMKTWQLAIAVPGGIAIVGWFIYCGIKWFKK